MTRRSISSKAARLRHFATRLLLSVGTCTTLFVSQHALSAPLNLSQVPLFVSSGAPANVFFLADDSGSMDHGMVTTDHNGNMLLQGYHTGTVRSATNNRFGFPAIRLATSASATNDYYINMVVKIESGPGAGQVRDILAYTGGAQQWAFLNSSWSVMPTTTSTYRIYKEYSYVFPRSTNLFPNEADLSGLYGNVIPSEAAVRTAANMPTDAHGVWRARYHGYNKLYYNPNINYQPWPGLDDAGNALPDAKSPTSPISLTALREDPYRASSPTVNITQNMSWTAYRVPTSGSDVTSNISVTGYYPAQYYTHNVASTVVGAGDAHTLYEIRAQSDASCSPNLTGMPVLCPETFTRTSSRTDCAAVNADQTRTCTRTEELKNFANWFMYYSRRALASKNAISRVVNQAQSDVRMGHGVINSDPDSPSSYNRQVALMNDNNTTGAKRSLLDAIYGAPTSGGTPLRTALDQTGKYFECTDGSVFGDATGYTCPWVGAAQGGTCQQSFTVLMTDGYYNDSFSGLGNVDADGNSPDATGNTQFDGGAYADTYSDTLADVAMHYYERDLSPLNNNVPVLAGVDNATHQHMTTYGVGFGVTGTLTASPTNPANAFSWPNPSVGLAQKIDDLRHAAYNGRGKFLNADSPDSLANALRSSIESITATTGSASAVAVNSRTLTTGTVLYQARFTSGEWSGDLRAISLNASSGNIGAELWSAREELKKATHPARVFVTFRRRGSTAECTGLASGTDGGVALTWGNISGWQQCQLNNDPATAGFENDGRGSQRLDWLKGSTALEGTSSGQFRPRAYGFKLGDIVNSTPAFVGAPTSLPDGLESSPHSTFRANYDSTSERPELLYVGANDGMLHAIDANTGQEKLAFVPSQVYPNLSKLTDINYKNSHLYFVDGSPTVADAFGAFDTSAPSKSTGCGTACWRTVLVSGLAGGGKGIFALDVTDPNGVRNAALRFTEANAANIVLWEFLDSTSLTPDPDMGYVYGEVAVSKMRNGQWAAIFGNGYNSANENAVLYIVDIATGALIKKIVLNPYGTATGNGNGLSGPAVFDRDNDFIADYIYAGDLRGNLWKIDVSSADVDDWGSAHATGTSPLPLFRAVDGSTGQPITARPVVRAHPAGQTGFMVYVGTGRYVTVSDKAPAASPVHNMYGIWDENTNTTSTPVARSDLLAQTITQTTAAFDLNNDGDTTDSGESSVRARIVSSNLIDWTTHKGWMLHLRTDQTDSSGEMSVSNPVLASADPERLIFTTLIPSESVCTFGGSGFLMEVSPINGGNLGVAVFDRNGDGVIDTEDNIGATANDPGDIVSGFDPSLGIMPEPVVVTKSGATPIELKLTTGSTGDVKSIKNYLTPPPAPGVGGRRSWRQLR